MDTIEWTGLSGKKYTYWFAALSNLASVRGNYAFVKKNPNGLYTPLYFGVAADLKARLTSHDRWDEAVKLGMTHVMGHTTPAGEAACLAEERDLIQKWQPALNTQHRAAR